MFAAPNGGAVLKMAGGHYILRSARIRQGGKPRLLREHGGLNSGSA